MQSIKPIVLWQTSLASPRRNPEQCERRYTKLKLLLLDVSLNIVNAGCFVRGQVAVLAGCWRLRANRTAALLPETRASDKGGLEMMHNSMHSVLGGSGVSCSHTWCASCKCLHSLNPLPSTLWFTHTKLHRPILLQ